MHDLGKDLGCRDLASAAEQLAIHLLWHAEGEPVRAMEAIAAVVANQVARDLLLTYPQPGTRISLRQREEAFRRRLAHSRRYKRPLASSSTAIYAVCLRIARRAVGGALHDPTGGATLFHPIGVSPPWQSRYVPVALIGGFLFYHEDSVRRFPLR